MDSLVCYHQWAVPTNIENISLLYKYIDYHGLVHSIDPAGYILVTTPMGHQEITFLNMFPSAVVRAEWRAAHSGRVGSGDPT